MENKSNQYLLSPAMLETITNLQQQLDSMHGQMEIQERAVIAFVMYCKKELGVPDDWGITRFVDGFQPPKTK